MSRFGIWALTHGYADDLELDRRDTDGNYCPENAGVTCVQQMQNTRKRKDAKTSRYKGVSFTVQSGK